MDFMTMADVAARTGMGESTCARCGTLTGRPLDTFSRRHETADSARVIT